MSYYLDQISPNPDRLGLHEAYMQMAEVWAKRSKSNRKQVGALIVKNQRIISDGYNGMPAGAKEDVSEEWVLVPDIVVEFKPQSALTHLMKTKDDVIHAESNAILKVAKNGGEGIAGADLYVTMSPCIDCAKEIIQSGITNVYYRETYRDITGIEKLKEYGVNVIKLD